jgi:DNA mismatch endonuclease (patch repair protein)
LDVFSPEERSEIMRRVRSVDTRPEKIVGSFLHRLGFRFRKHRRYLPGTPDFVLPKYKTSIFVHGCFWHRHPGCPNADAPATRREYWLPKFSRTVDRDQKNQQALHDLGWNVIVIWECEIRNVAQLEQRLKSLILKRYDNSGRTEYAFATAAEKQRKYEPR